MKACFFPLGKSGSTEIQPCVPFFGGLFFVGSRHFLSPALCFFGDLVAFLAPFLLQKISLVNLKQALGHP